MEENHNLDNLPAISVVMSVYNGANYLKEAIESILLQAFANFEFIIVDDGSTDESLSIIKSYKDQRIILIVQHNIGLAKALNRAIAKAKAPLIARMDADDISLPSRLENQYTFMHEHPEYVACGSWANVMDKSGNYIYTGKNIENNESIQDYLGEKLSKGFPDTPFFHSSVMFRTESFNQIGGYSEYMFRAQDVVLFNKMRTLGKFYNIPLVLINYRIVPEAISRRKMHARSLGELLKKVINDEIINEKLFNSLIISIDKTNSLEREYNYLIFLSKKYIWNNYSPTKSRENLIRSINLKRFRIYPYFLFITTFIPRRLILKIYNLSKSQKSRNYRIRK